VRLVESGNGIAAAAASVSVLDPRHFNRVKASRAGTVIGADGKFVSTEPIDGGKLATALAASLLKSQQEAVDPGLAGERLQFGQPGHEPDRGGRSVQRFGAQGD
jgi:hypothetical protein